MIITANPSLDIPQGSPQDPQDNSSVRTIKFKDYQVSIRESGDHYLIDVSNLREGFRLPTLLVHRLRPEEIITYIKLPPPNNLDPDLTLYIYNYLRGLGNNELTSDVVKPSEVIDVSKSSSEIEIAKPKVVDVKALPLIERVKYVSDNIVELLTSLGVNIIDFEKARTEVKASIIYKVLTSVFDFVRIPPLEPTKGESNVYVLDGNVLNDVKEVIRPIVGVLIASAVSRRNLVSEVETAVYSTPNIVYWDQVDPWDKLNLANGVLDLKELKIMDNSNTYFRYRLNVSITNEELNEIKEGNYKLEDNEVYKLWRNHFDDQNWEFLKDSLGTWLAPYRFKHITFLIGPTDSGKSTFIENLIKPIRPIVSTTSLRSITDYQFGLESLVGKQINVYCERGQTVLKNIDLINNLIGAHDYITVHRKFKPSTIIRSLKTMFFAMNDPPILFEYGGETLWAFVNRLSIIHMYAPEGFKPESEVSVDPKEVFKFLLVCRVLLERNNWVIKKLDNEEILDYLMKASNSALRFLEESGYIEPDPMGSVKGTELYEVYVRWCNEVGVRQLGRDQFYTTVATKYYKYPREGTAWFKGLRIKYSKLTENRTLYD